MLWFLKKCADCVHVWVQVLVYNAVFKSILEKKLWIFYLRSLSFMCCRWNVYRSYLIPRTSPALKNFWLGPWAVSRHFCLFQSESGSSKCESKIKLQIPGKWCKKQLYSQLSQRHSQDPVKHLRWSVLQKYLMALSH